MPDKQPAPFVKKDFAALVEDLLKDAAQGGGGRISLTDAREGSVTRTLLEVFARELAVFYEQLDSVYQNAYLATAQGAALDKVVWLLGVKRRQPGHLEGRVSFARSLPAPEDIYIPAGTLVSGKEVLLCATLQDATLQRGELVVQVEIQSLEPAQEGEAIPSRSLQIMPRPITGIEQVYNELALVKRQQGETDADLRNRAHTALHAMQSGTPASLEQSVRALGIAQVKVLEYPDDPSLTPGRIKVVVGDPNLSDETMTLVRQRIQQVRPAGVLVETTKTRHFYIDLSALLTLEGNLSPLQKQAIETALIAKLQHYFSQITTGMPIRQEKIRSILISHDAVMACEPLQTEFLMQVYRRPEANSSTSWPNDTPLYQNSNGDIMIPADGCGVLELNQFPIRLLMQGPEPRVYLDFLLENVSLNESYSLEDVTAQIAAKFVNQINELNGKHGKHGKQREITDYNTSFEVFWEQLEQLSPDKPQYFKRDDTTIALVITIVRENTGQIIELKWPKSPGESVSQEQPKNREVIELRSVSIIEKKPVAESPKQDTQ